MKKIGFISPSGNSYAAIKKGLTVMKITLLFILISTLNLLATGSYSQTTRVSLKLNQTSVKQVLKEIEHSSEFYFLYNNELIDVERKVDIEANNEPINSILDNLFANANVKYAVYDRQIVISPTNMNLHQEAQHKVNGKVIDQYGAAIPGASVVVKGTTIGVTTSNDGNFSLLLPNDAKFLLFSFVGMRTQEVAIDNRSNYSITLADVTIGLDEVVAIGFGTKKKSELTNAVDQIQGDIAAKVPSVTLTPSLQGQLAGLNIVQNANSPGFDNPTINIRGANTFGTSAALIVIDGVANADPDGLNKLDPNDIATITVLKDASAGIYGVEAAGGVILVTTKRGNLGAAKVHITTSSALQTPTRLPKMADAVSFMKALDARNELDGTAITYSDAAIAEFTSGQKKSTNWMKSLLKTPVYQGKYDISVSGGTEKVKYFISVGTGDQNTAIINDNKFKLIQNNLRVNLDINLLKGLDMGIDLSYRSKGTYTSAYGAGGQLGACLDFNPTLPAFINGDINKPTNGDGSLSPVAVSLSPGFIKYDTKVYSGKFNLKYLIPKTGGLYISSFTSLILNSDFTKQFITPYNFYTQDEQTGVVTKNQTTLPGSYVNGLSESFDQYLRNTFHAEIGYNHLFKEVHKVSAFAAYEDMNYTSDVLSAGRTQFNSYAIPELFAGVANSQYFQNNGSSSILTSQTFFGRATYDFKSKYLFNFNFRADGSSIFAPAKRWGYFPGVSAGWVISKEEFMPKGVFDNLKLRASWGQLGNDRVLPFQYLSSFAIATGTVINNSDAQGLAITTAANPNITWEVSTSSNIGIEMGFLNNRLSIELDYFKVLTDHILAKKSFSIPAYTGLVLPDQNIGTMMNHGYEAQVAFRDRIGKFNYSISGNVALNQNKITYFDEVPNINPKVAAYQNLTGHPLGSPLFLHAVGIYKTDAEALLGATYPGAKAGYLKYQDKNGDGKIDGNDMYRKGLNPELKYGFQFTAKYSGFDLAMYFNGSLGDFWQFGNNFVQTRGNNLQYAAVHSFTKSNPNAELPKSGINSVGLASDFNLLTRSWLRFKTLNLGYSFPKSKLLSKLNISNLRIYASMDNFFMLYNNMHKYGACDPELLVTVYGGYPMMSTHNLGVDITF